MEPMHPEDRLKNEIKFLGKTREAIVEYSEGFDSQSVKPEDNLRVKG